jgi:hypothetical protein
VSAAHPVELRRRELGGRDPYRTIGRYLQLALEAS